MTTIVTDGRVVAADSRISADLIYSAKSQKIFVVGDEIIGTRGECDLGEAYLDWVRRGSDRANLPVWPAGDDVTFEAIHVSKRGVWVVDGPNFARTKMALPFAIGSGAPVALGAMMAGATPANAVRIASKLDPATGGKIWTLHVPGKRR